MNDLETGLHYPLKLDSLPAGWKVGYVGDFTEEIQPGFASGKHNKDGVGIPHIRPFNINREGKLDLSEIKSVAPNSDAKRLKTDDVLFNNTNSPELIGKTAVILSAGNWGFSNHMTRIRFKRDIEPKFAAYQLHYLWMVGYYLYNCVKHVNQASISSKTLANAVPFISPPYDQQKRIVAEIEKQFSRLDEAVANLKRVKANLKRYKAAVLKAAVEGRFVETEAELGRRDWELKPINIAIESLDQGWSPQCENEAAKGEDDWAVMKTTAVQSLQYFDAENKKLPTKLKPRPHLELQTGDLLITRAGPRSRVGVACLVRSTRRHIMLCDKVYRLRCKKEAAKPEFLELALNAPDVVDALDELKTGISDSGVNLTQKRFQELLVPIPSVSEQERTIMEVDRCLSLVQGADVQVSANLMRVEHLRQAILKNMFNRQLLIK